VNHHVREETDGDLVVHNIVDNIAEALSEDDDSQCPALNARSKPYSQQRRTLDVSLEAMDEIERSIDCPLV